MSSDRKQVTVCTRSDKFARALRILLAGHDVALVAGLAEVDGSVDLLIYRPDDGLELIPESVARVASSVPTLVLGSEDMMIPAVDAGCRGFLLSSASLDEVEEAADTILGGGAVVPPDLLGRLLRHLVERRRKTVAPAGVEQLTEREREVFQLAARGARKDQIGEALFISPATARTHLQRVYRKLGVHSQAELVALASEVPADDEGEGP